MSTLSATVGETIGVWIVVVVAVAWIWFNVAVMLAVLRTARATEESAHVLDLILRELRRYRPK